VRPRSQGQEGPPAGAGGVGVGSILGIGVGDLVSVLVGGVAAWILVLTGGTVRTLLRLLVHDLIRGLVVGLVHGDGLVVDRLRVRAHRLMLQGLGLGLLR